MKGLCSNEHEGWFRDVRGILTVTETAPGLPLPSITPSGASFNYAHVAHAEDAREMVAAAEEILSYAFGVNFEDNDPPAIGSSRHHIRTAWLPSGLPLSIVALAQHFDGQDARQDTRKLVAA